MKKAIVLIISLMAVPISLWLQYKTLRMIQATELMMFLYWVNVPLIVLIQILTKLIENEGKR